MPERTETFPGSWSSSLPWDDMADGEPWVITAEEMADAGVKMETVRVAAHAYAKSVGIKFRTKTVGGNLNIQATDKE